MMQTVKPMAVDWYAVHALYNLHSHEPFRIIVKFNHNTQTIPNQQYTVVECVVCCKYYLAG